MAIKNIGYIADLTGSAQIRTADGFIRIVSIGDTVSDRDVLITGQGETVSIVFNSGQKLQVAENSEVLLDETVSSISSNYSDEQVDQLTTLQQTLLEGQDVAELDPTAAGNDQGETAALHQTSTYERDGREGTVDTRPTDFVVDNNNFGQIFTNNDAVGIVPQNVAGSTTTPPPVVSSAPVITVLANDVTEESVAANQVIASFTSSDPDGDALTHSLVNDTNNYFNINGNNVELTAAGVAAINNDTLNLSSMTITVQASDGTNTTNGSDVSNITRVNDNAPVITVAANDVTEESVAVNQVIASFTSSDPDGDTLSHSLVNDPNNYFQINGNNVELTAAGVAAINNDTLNLSSMTITVQASDGTNTTNGSDVSNITRVNDNAPVINVTTNDVTEESVAVNQVIASFTSSDPDGDTLTHSLVNDTNNYFQINGNNVELTAAGVAAINNDTLNLSTLTITVQASDGTNTTNGSDVSNITRVNDNAPIITVTANDVSEESVSVNQVIASFTSSDPDGDTLSHSLLNDTNNYFQINGNNVELTAAGVTAINNDTLNLNSLTITIQASDGTNTTNGSDVSNITRVNDNAPVISVTANDVTEESVAVNQVIASFTSSDPDGDTLTHSLVNDPNNYFNINGNNVELAAAGVAAINNDTLNLSTLTITVQASDGTNTTNASDVSNITRVNDNPVVLIDNDSTANQVNENSATGTTVGITGLGSDADGATTITYSLADTAGGRFAINATTGVVTVADGSLLDYETATSHSISITATSSDGSVTTETYAINIVNVNDTVPTISINTVAGDDVIDDSEDNNITISGITTYAEENQTVTISIVNPSGASVYTGTGLVLANGSWSVTGIDLSAIPDGASYTVRADVTDVAGNPAVQATRNISTLDTTAAETNAVTSSGLEDATSIAITLSGSDDNGSVASFNLNGLPTNGSLYTDSALTTLASAGVDYTASGDQVTLYFVPTANWSGSTNFQYSANDANGLVDSTPATATINVTAVADTPNLQVTLNESADKVIFNDNFNDGHADGWNYIGFNNRNSQWRVDNGTLIERSNSARGFFAYDTNNAGTDLDTLDNYSISADAGTAPNGSSSSNDAVGFIFGYSDTDNYYMVRWNDLGSNYSGNSTYRDFELVNVVGGTATVLDMLNQQTLPVSFNLNVSVTQSGGIQVYVDGTQMLTAASEMPAIGTFGLWTDNNDNGVSYDNVRVTALADGNTDVIAYEGVPLDFNVTAALTDLDNSETLSTVVSGITVGATLSDGTNSFIATTGNTFVDISNWNQNSLSISGLSDGNHSLTVTSTSTEQSNSSNASSIQTLDIEVISVNAPVALDVVDSVKESVLSDGTAPDTSELTTSGNLLQGQAGSSLVEVDGNTAVGGVITIQSTTGTLEVFTLAGTYNGVSRNAGDYSYTLENSTTDGLNDTDQFIYTIDNGFGTQTTGSLAVNIVDDAPIGTDVTANIVDSSAATQTTNLVIVLDRSGSMGWDLEGDRPGNSNFNANQVRMDIAKDALQSMFDSFDDLGNVNIKFVDFSSSVNESQWYVDDKSSANGYLDGVTPNGGTYYDSALNATMSGYNPPTADTTLVYFISDGEPSSGRAVDATLETNWENFVQNNNIDISYGIGITGSVNLSSLQPIAFPDSNTNGDVEPYAIQVLNAVDLKQTLLNTVSEGIVQGDSSILTGSGTNGIILGADGGYIESIMVDGVLHSYNSVSNVSESITTTRGGTMEINYETGEYIYTINPKKTISGEQETFLITGVDGDGDTKEIDLVINLDYVANIDANRDNVITNASASESIDIDYAALMANDVVTSTMNVSNVVATGATSISSDSDSVTVNNVVDGDSFSYDVSDGTVSDTTQVDVTVVNSDTLTGSDNDDILIGTRTTNSLSGGLGDDSLLGGSGVDILTGGAGNDTLTGGTANDTFVWENGDAGTTTVPAKDIVTDFTLGAGGDVLNLADMLQGETTSNLTDYLNFQIDANGNTVINVDTNGGGVFESSQQITLMGVDVSFGGSLTTDQQILDGLLASGNLIVD